GEAEEDAVAPLPSSRRSQTPTPPSACHAGAAVRNGWTTQRGRRRRRAGVDERRRHRTGGIAGGESDSSGDDDASDGGASTAWSRNSSDVDLGEATSLGLLRVPPLPAGLGSGSGASAARLHSSVSSAGSAHRVDENASEDDKASGTTGEEEDREG
ncbi:unnamed protein product, partial [Ectocarpus sp. 12 AP-2014]